jgi:hypothetical protein
MFDSFLRIIATAGHGDEDKKKMKGKRSKLIR